MTCSPGPLPVPTPYEPPRYVDALSVYVGDTFSKTYRFRYRATGAPVDLDGWTGRAQIRRTVVSDRVLAEMFVSVVPTGTVQLHMTAATTELLRSFPYGVWDLQLTSPDGVRVWTPVSGTVRMVLDATTLPVAAGG